MTEILSVVWGGNQSVELSCKMQLSKENVEILISQNVISSWGGDRKLPYAFTEQGIAMLSSVLKSPTVVDVNIRIMRAFVSMRRFIATNV